MPDEELRESWNRTEGHLRDALTRQPIPDDVRTQVLDLIDHNEFGVALELMTNALVEVGAALEPSARQPLAVAAREMRLEDNPDWRTLSL